jgi:hypothetical protein
MPLHVKAEMTHYDEMDDKIFDIDIDMNVWVNARNVIESISFHRFHRPVVGSHIFGGAVSR